MTSAQTGMAHNLNSVVSVTIYNGSQQQTQEDIKPLEIVPDEQTGKTYINLQPNDLPPTFIPQHNETALEHSYMANIMPDFAGGYSDAMQLPNSMVQEQVADPLQVPQTLEPALQNFNYQWPQTPCNSDSASVQLIGNKRPATATEDIKPWDNKKLAMVNSFQQMSMVQQQTQLIHAVPTDTPIPPPRKSCLASRMPLQPVMMLPNPQRVQTADALTDARDILAHAASVKKAKLLLQCCRILKLDDGGMMPPDEDPTLHYLVL